MDGGTWDLTPQPKSYRTERSARDISACVPRKCIPDAGMHFVRRYDAYSHGDVPP